MKKGKIRVSVMSVTIILFIAMLAAILINADAFYDILYNVVMNNLMWGLGWFVCLVCLVMVIICVICLVTPIGKIRLGGPNAKPKFTYMQWFGISLCTGIGAGVVFWGAAEPLLFTMEPDPSTGLAAGSNGALVWSMTHCFLQWGFTPYATCVVMGVILAYLIHNKKAPFKTSSCLIPILGKDAPSSKIGTAFDAWCAFSIVAAVAGGLGYGAMQLSAGIKAFAGIEPTTMMYVGIIAVMFVLYNLSAISGLRSGITMLSNLNTRLFFVLLLFVFLAGPTGYICNLFTHSLGQYGEQFLGLSLYTAPFADSGLWPQNWDMYWWVDWMAYAPLLGLFMVRVGYGRTIREFVMVEWFFPALFGLVWFAVFGGTILHAQIYQNVDFYSIYTNEGAEALTLAMFNVLPFTKIAKIVMLFVITVSLVTQCDSMAVTCAGMAFEGADENHEPPVGMKLFWGIVFAVVAAVFVSLGGIGGVKTIKSFAGIPMTFFCTIIMIGFFKYLFSRPRTVRGDYEYEAEVANAPDNGEPAAPLDGIDKLFAKFTNRKKADK